MAAISDFGENSGVKAEKLPTEEEAKEIEDARKVADDAVRTHFTVFAAPRSTATGPGPWPWLPGPARTWSGGYPPFRLGVVIGLSG